MRSKKEQKTARQPRNGKKPAQAGPALKPHKPEAGSKRTIKQVIIETIAKNSAATNDEMIVAVKAEFPKSALNDSHAAWFRSQARKGSLTGSPVTIPVVGRRQPKTSE